MCLCFSTLCLIPDVFVFQYLVFNTRCVCVSVPCVWYQMCLCFSTLCLIPDVFLLQYLVFDSICVCVSVPCVWHSDDDGGQTQVLNFPRGVHLRCPQSLPWHHQPLPLHPLHLWQSRLRHKGNIACDTDIPSYLIRRQSFCSFFSQPPDLNSSSHLWSVAFYDLISDLQKFWTWITWFLYCILIIVWYNFCVICNYPPG